MSTTSRLHTVATHTPDHDTTALLRTADDILKRARFAARLAEAAPRRNSNAGRRPVFGEYRAHGVACALSEIIAARRPYSVIELLNRLWFVYTDTQMNIIGLQTLRTQGRIRQMRPAPDPDGTNHAQVEAAWKANRAEYQRLWDFIQTAFAGMDDTPLVANHDKAHRPTKAQVAAAARKPALAPRTALQADLVNAIIIAGLDHENDKRFPGTNLHSGLLLNHRGHIAVDETHLSVGLGELPKDAAPANFKARRHAKSREHGDKTAPALVGATLGVAIADPHQDTEVPNVCLGAAIHHPTGGLGSAILTIIQGIDENGARAPRPSSRNQQIVVDGGYPERHGLNVGAHERGYGLVFQPRTAGRRTLYPLTPTGTDSDGDFIPGIHLHKGIPMCPGVPPATLRDLKFDVPETLTGFELESHARQETLLRAFRMPTSGRPAKTKNRRRGGQAATAPPAEDVMQVKLTCPMVKGTARCRLFAEYDDPNYAHLPPIPAPPVDLPFEKRPACCNNPSGETRVNIAMDVFKTWQEFMPGTWEHADWYSSPRAHSEGINSLLKREHGGGNLHRGLIAPRKAPLYVLGVTFAITVNNRRIIETWSANLARNQGTPPKPGGHQTRKERQLIHDTYLASRRKKPA